MQPLPFALFHAAATRSHNWFMTRPLCSLRARARLCRDTSPDLASLDDLMQQERWASPSASCMARKNNIKVCRRQGEAAANGGEEDGVAGRVE